MASVSPIIHALERENQLTIAFLHLCLSAISSDLSDTTYYHLSLHVDIYEPIQPTSSPQHTINQRHLCNKLILAYSLCAHIQTTEWIYNFHHIGRLNTIANLLDAVQAKLDLCHDRLPQRFLFLHRIRSSHNCLLGLPQQGRKLSLNQGRVGRGLLSS